MSSLEFACVTCGEGFVSMNAVKFHMKHKHATRVDLDEIPNQNCNQLSSSFEFTCLVCDEGFVSLNALEVHLLHEHPGVDVDEIPNQNGSFTCGLCDQEFETIYARKVHVSRIHESSTPPVEADSSVPANSVTVPHTSTKVKQSRPTKGFAHKIADYVYACKCCDATFSSSTAVRVHVTHKHTLVESEPANENGKFTCGICDRECKTTRGRSIHTSRVHRKLAKAADVISSTDSVAQKDDKVLDLVASIKKDEFLRDFMALVNNRASTSRDDDDEHNFDSLAEVAENQKMHPPSSSREENTVSSSGDDERHESVPKEEAVNGTKNNVDLGSVSANAIDDDVSATLKATSDEANSNAQSTVASVVSPPSTSTEDVVLPESIRLINREIASRDHNESENVCSPPTSLERATETEIELTVDTNQNIIVEQPPPAEGEGSDELTASVKLPEGTAGHSRTPEDVPQQEDNQLAKQTTLYPCSFCERSFAKLMSRRSHMRVHKHRSWRNVGLNLRKAKPRRWDLSPSDVRPTARRKFADDVSARTRSWVHKCTECSALFPNATALSKHSKTHDLANEWCSEVGTKATLETHSETRPPSADVAITPTAETMNWQSVRVCLVRLSDTFANVDQNRTANVNVVGDEPVIHSCKYCSRQFRSRRVYELHVQWHSTQGGKSDSVAHLPGTFANDGKNRTANVDVTGDEPVIHSCNYCSRQFRSRRVYESHVEWHNTQAGKSDSVDDLPGTSAFWCEYCERQFQTLRGYARHVGWHNAGGGKSDSVADADSEQLPNASAVDSVPATADPVVVEFDEILELYACDMCDEIFEQRKDLCEHVHNHADPLLSVETLPADGECTLTPAAAVPSGGGHSFNCPNCDRSFPGQRNLRVHVTKAHRKRKRASGHWSKKTWSPVAVSSRAAVEDGSTKDTDEMMYSPRKRGRREEALKRHDVPQIEPRPSPTPVSQYLCDSCGLCFRSTVTLGRHMEMECEMREAVKKYDDGKVVENSDGVFKQELSGKATLGVHHDSERDRIQNPVRSNFKKSPNESFNEEKSLEAEKAVDIESFICRCCFKIFASESDVQLHENQPQKLLFCCGLCNLYFVDTTKAENHTILMHSVQEKET